MKIAVPFENGMICRHFGHAPAFKVYETEGGAIQKSEVLSAGGNGHEALAGMLRSIDVDTVICGGIGAGAQMALNEAGIRLFAGAEGDPDQAVEKLLCGDLPENSEANCDHHHEEEHSCCGEQEDCHSCCEQGESGCQGCRGMIFGTGRNAGKTVRVHYRGTFNDGTEFDSSYERGEPLELVCGAGMMIPGFDAAVAEMEAGEIVQVHLMPEEAYGEADPAAVVTLELKELPGAETLAVGQRILLQDVYGQPIPVKVAAKDAETITFDANPEMAGKELNFTIELVEVLE